jgi:hypothetical protein
MIRKPFVGIISSSLALLASAGSVFAQEEGKPFFCFPQEDIPFSNLGLLLSRALLLLFFFAAVLAFVFIVIGGIQWITAGGDKIAAQAARDRITAAVVGLLIVVAAFAITFIVTSALNINIFGGVIDFPGGSIFDPVGECPKEV